MSEAIRVTVELPQGEGCIYAGSRCPFLKYSAKRECYNCALNHRLLKGGKMPKKCKTCAEYCEAYTGKAADDENNMLP